MFANCPAIQFAMCLGVVAIFLLNVMDVFCVCDAVLLDRPCMVPQRVLCQVLLPYVLPVSLYVGSYLLIQEPESWITGVRSPLFV